MPILISELLHSIDNAKKDGLVHIDDWKLSDVDYLHNMGFNFDDDYKMSTPKEPIITIYKKEDEQVKEGQDPKSMYHIEEKGKSLKKFEKFTDIINFFDNYAQPEIDKRR